MITIVCTICFNTLKLHYLDGVNLCYPMVVSVNSDYFPVQH
jgi:hypothetical protein